MSTAPIQIQNCQEFWEHIVKPDYGDFHACTSDLRLAFHCSISLFHMCDWVYVNHKPAIDQNFTFLNKHQNRQAVTNEKQFANSLVGQCSEFDLVRGIANSAKHLQLKNLGSQPNFPSNAANTINRSTGYGQGPHGQGPYGGVTRVMLQGPNGTDRNFSDISEKVFRMWKALSLQHNWQLG